MASEACIFELVNELLEFQNDNVDRRKPISAASCRKRKFILIVYVDHCSLYPIRTSNST